MVDVVTDRGRVDPFLTTGVVGVHPYEVEHLTTYELLHLHGSSRGVVSRGGILCEISRFVEFAIVTEEDVSIGVGSSPVLVYIAVAGVDELRIDLTTDEDVGGVTLAVAALSTIGVMVSVRVGEEEFTVETIGVLHLTHNVVQRCVVSGVRGNIVTTELVVVLAPQTRVVVHGILSCAVVGSRIIGRAGGDVGAVGRLVLVVRGVIAVLLVEVERAFTLSYYVGEVVDRSEDNCVAVSFRFNSGSRGVVALDVVAGSVGRYEHTSHGTLYGYLSAVHRSRSVQGLCLVHVVLNVDFTCETGHDDHVLLGGTGAFYPCEVIGYGEGITVGEVRGGRCGISSVVDRGSGSTILLEGHHAVVLRFEGSEVGSTGEKSLGFGVGINHNEYLLLTRINLEALLRTNVSHVAATGCRLLEFDLRSVEVVAGFERVTTGGSGVGLEDVDVYGLDEVVTDPLTGVVELRVRKVLLIICRTFRLGHLKRELDRHHRRAFRIVGLDSGRRIVIRAGSERSYRGRGREEHSCEEKMFLHNE